MRFNILFLLFIFLFIIHISNHCQILTFDIHYFAHNFVLSRTNPAGLSAVFEVFTSAFKPTSAQGKQEKRF